MSSLLPDILAKRELLELEQRRKALQDANGLAFYRPHYKQDLFHSAANYPRRFSRTGNRFGKTTQGVSEDIAYARGERSWYKVGFEVKDKDGIVKRIHDPILDADLITRGIPRRSTRGVIFCQDWDKVRSVFTSEESGASRGKLWQLLPKDWFLGADKDKQGNLYRFRIKNLYGETSTIQFETVNSFMQNPMAHESEWWDWIHIDEPCPQDMWAAYARGLADRGGFAWFTCTPLTEQWINDYFIPRFRTRDNFTDGEEFRSETTAQGKVFVQFKWIITGSIFDNPNLAPESVAQMIADTPLDQRETRIEGRPRALSGVIYPEFNHDIHIYRDTPPGWADPYTPPDDYCIKIAIDPHPRTPHAVLFDAISPTGYHFFYAEIFQHCLIRELCDLIFQVPGADRAFAIIIDPLAFTESVTGDGTMMIDDFRAGGIYGLPASKDLTRGILKVQAWLSMRDYNGHSVLRFHESLLNTTYEFDRYIWDPKKPEPYRKAPDHHMECLYRLLIDGIEWSDPSSRPTPIIAPRSIVRPEFTLQGMPADPVKALLRRDVRFPTGHLPGLVDSTRYEETARDRWYKSITIQKPLPFDSRTPLSHVPPIQTRPRFEEGKVERKRPSEEGQEWTFNT